MSNREKQTGLTLLEVLVATSIFAIALTVAAGVFASVMRYDKKSEVSRNVDFQTRSLLTTISQEVRGSQGVITDKFSGLTNSYYNFAIVPRSGLGSNRFTEGDELIVALKPEEHYRKYYLQNNQIMAVDYTYDNGDLISSRPESLMDEKFNVKSLDFKGRSARLGQTSTKYPWLTLELEMEYQDPRERAELKSEKITVSTTISPRNFDFIYE